MLRKGKGTGMALSPVDMSNKVCIVTGGTSGIGWVTTFQLAQWGATVLLIGRDLQRGLGAEERIRSEAGNRSVKFFQTDLAAQDQIHQFVSAFHQGYDRLDVLVNNAGITLLTRRLSEAGVEMTFAVNHLGHFLLTNLLLNTLKESAPSRVINVSSGSHRGAQIDFDNLRGESGYRGLQAYGQSKLANVLFTYELARRMEGTGVTVNAVHPGFVLTNLGRDNGWLIHKIIRLAMRLRGISSEEGAETLIYLATSPELERVTGKYFHKIKPVETSPQSYNSDTALRLWEISEELTGLGPSS
jgi:NAD(P)-dependent dehydrogenase (short-subunit alcohol dehydrogenase family)